MRPGISVAPAASMRVSPSTAGGAPASSPTYAIVPCRTTTVSPSASGASRSPVTMAPILLTRRLATPSSDLPPNRGALLDPYAHQLLTPHHIPKMGVDVVEGGSLFTVAGGADAVLWDEDVVAEEVGVVDRRSHADVGDNARYDDLPDFPFPQPQVQIGAEESTIAPLRDLQLIRRDVHGVDDRRVPGAADTVRHTFLELPIFRDRVLVTEPDDAHAHL